MVHIFITALLFLSTQAFSAPALDHLYTEIGNNNTQTSFDMIVVINDPAIVASRDLHVQPEYAPLHSTESVLYPPMSNAVIQYMPLFNLPYVRVTITGLDPTTMYQARVTFSRLDGTSLTELQVSPWYYTTTRGTDPKSLIRDAMILKGMKEYFDSEHGTVGENGTVAVDGTRYGATPGEKWCTEFYSWVGTGSLNGIAGLTNVTKMTNYFTGHGGWTLPGQIVEKARRGDYLSMDTDLDGEANHSGMFLAHESASDGQYIWTLEGNSGNKVQVHRRLFDSKIVGVGHIMNSQF